ncbi:hypothetical protein K457DRAFT_125074 [Linnemannia elongata AG-77]|uniref:Uncharacterized protein n=1 Tax=Linnemannia elongata AG-77 TaxID=1314771 RepID=A0A197JYH8_9FUNG|nr:hypothetical protein K457DRAFT_125074 [Linnemannia elongata AG-77]
MPRLSRTCTSLCSLAMALAFIFALTTNSYAKDPHHLLSHNRQQRPPQQHHQPGQHYQDHNHHHDPTLAGALFPVDSEILAGNKEYVKEPCPTGCVHHRSDVYLAVTSIGEGFPRIQFTCSHPHLSQPTANPQYPEGNHQHYQQHHAHPGHSRSQGDNIIQEPADPIPEHIPHLPSHGCGKYSHLDSHESTDGASIYTDLRITADPHLRGSAPMDRNAANAAGGFNPHYDFVFSPRERSHSVDSSDDAAESHTTTMTFSDDDNSLNEHVASDERKSIPLTAAADDDQDPHHQQVHILPIHDHHYHHHRPDVSPPGSLHKTDGSGSTTPEPIATLAAPTSSSFEAGSNRGRQGMNDDRAVSKPAAVHEYKAGPAAPTPEAFPGQTNTAHIQNHDHSNHQQQHQGDVSVSGEEMTAGDEKPMVRYRTIIHRVTTLIVETETIVNRPTATPTTTAAAFMQGSKEKKDGRAQRQYSHDKKEGQHGRDSYAYGPHIGDHIMFDAGVDGEMVISIASSDKSSRRHNHKAPLAR